MTPTPGSAEAFEAMLGRAASHLEGVLGLAGLAAADGRLETALRLADRARRLCPSDATLGALVDGLAVRLGHPARVAEPAPAPPSPAPRAPATLILTLGRDGGVRRHVAERAARLIARGSRAYALAPDAEENAGGACRLIAYAGDRDAAAYRLPEDFEALIATLRGLAIGHVEIHHVLGLDPAVLEIPARIGVGHSVHIHDYSWICPRITLIGGDGVYCGEPDLAACEACVRRHGALIEEDITVAGLRGRSARMLAGATRVVAPTRDVAARLGRYFPGVAVTVTPWEPAVEDVAPAPARSGGRARIAVLGAIGEHKGFTRLLDCARDAAARDLPLDFVVIGYSQDDPALFATGRVFVTGPYAEAEAARLLARERCAAVFLPSVWPETWCYTLTHGLRSGLPILAHDIGAMGERLASVARARLAPLETTAAALNALLMAMTGDDDPESAPGGQAPAIVAVRAGGVESVGGDGVAWIEAFRIEGGLAGDAVRYRAVQAGGRRSDWAAAGAWCGAAGPLMGVEIAGWPGRARATFSSGHVLDRPCDGAAMVSPVANDPLVRLEML